MRQEAQNPNLVWDKYKSPLISVICGSEKFLRVPLRLLRCYTSPQQAPYQRCNLMDGLGTQSEEGYLQNRSSHILSTPRFLRLSADSVDKPSASEAYVLVLTVSVCLRLITGPPHSGRDQFSEPNSTQKSRPKHNRQKTEDSNHTERTL
ncbi:hypothetical protein M514_11171 [Trichuris suis]|uniref:Uncharacterized protein n=1 Tax=Trichuris suis TaxID=68888 RepID=A0A085N3Y9_9BILA|nr:hypothetical protein M514_11171 [Trichuris suis]